MKEYIHKWYAVPLVVIMIVIILFSSIYFLLKTTETKVVDKLVNTGVNEDSITSEPFISNLEGRKNWMVNVEIKGDPKVYSYYINSDDKVVLESTVLDDEVDVLNKVIE